MIVNTDKDGCKCTGETATVKSVTAGSEDCSCKVDKVAGTETVAYK